MPEAHGPILVLDDDPEIVALVHRVLTHDGHEVATATDPRAALELVDRTRPRLVIVDLMLPHMDGEDFLRAIERRFGQRPPVIILSASAVRREVARRTGAAGSLEKPFQVDDLREMVARILGR